MKKFTVSFETRDYYEVSIEAENEESAKDQAWQIFKMEPGAFWIACRDTECVGVEEAEEE